MCRKQIYTNANRLDLRPAAEKLGCWPEIQPICHSFYHSPSKISRLSRFLTVDDIYNLFLENYPAFKGLINYTYIEYCNW